MKSKKDDILVEKIIKRYGAVIDLRANPEIIIDIVRRFVVDEPPDGGTPCGGVPSPPPPPSPSESFEGRVTNEELMKAILKIARDVSGLKNALPTGRARRR